MKTKSILFAILFLIPVLCWGQFDTLKQFSNQNIICLQDTNNKKIHFVFDANGLTAEQFNRMRVNLEIELLFMRIYK